MKNKKIRLLFLVILAAGIMIVIYRKNFAEQPLKAMYIFGEEEHLMVDQKTGTAFTVTMPEKILDENGKRISEKALRKGDLVAVYGDGIMLESYPGQYPGVTKIKILKRGKASDVDKYQDIIDQLQPERDPRQLPALNVVYCTSYGTVSGAALPGGYNWSDTDEEGKVQTQVKDRNESENWKELPVMNVDKATDIELNFDLEPAKVTITAYAAELFEKENSDMGAEVEVKKKDGKYLLEAAEKDMVYVIHGQWENGWVEFGIAVK